MNTLTIVWLVITALFAVPILFISAIEIWAICHREGNKVIFVFITLEWALISLFTLAIAAVTVVFSRNMSWWALSMITSAFLVGHVYVTYFWTMKINFGLVDGVDYDAIMKTGTECDT